MAYAKTNSIQRLGPQGYSNSVWFYVDGDALGTIDGSGYFNLEADKLVAEDMIFASGNSVLGIFRVNSVSAGVVDVDNAIPLPTAVVDSD